MAAVRIILCRARGGDRVRISHGLSEAYKKMVFLMQLFSSEKAEK